MELFKFIRLGIIFIGVGLSNCSTPGEYKIQGTATGIGQGMVCIISYLDKKQTRWQGRNQRRKIRTKR